MTTTKTKKSGGNVITKTLAERKKQSPMPVSVTKADVGKLYPDLQTISAAFITDYMQKVDYFHKNFAGISVFRERALFERAVTDFHVNGLTSEATVKFAQAVIADLKTIGTLREWIKDLGANATDPHKLADRLMYYARLIDPEVRKWHENLSVRFYDKTGLPIWGTIAWDRHVKFGNLLDSPLIQHLFQSISFILRAIPEGFTEPLKVIKKEVGDQLETLPPQVTQAREAFIAFQQAATELTQLEDQFLDFEQRRLEAQENPQTEGAAELFDESSGYGDLMKRMTAAREKYEWTHAQFHFASEMVGTTANLINSTGLKIEIPYMVLYQIGRLTLSTFTLIAETVSMTTAFIYKPIIEQGMQARISTVHKLKDTFEKYHMNIPEAQAARHNQFDKPADQPSLPPESPAQ